MMKYGGKGLLLLAAALVVATGFTPQAWAKNAAAESFAQQDQTIEYHFMIEEGNLTEKDLAKGLPAAIIEPLKPLCDVGPASKSRKGIYIDSRARILEKNNLILRVREGSITVKARGLSPAVVTDLERCSLKKYEIDYFALPEYSISSDIKFKKEEFDVSPSKMTIQGLLGFMKSKCPALFEQIWPVVKDGTGLEIPGVATMYSFDVTLKHPLARKLKEADLAVWFFPPTNRALVEPPFTGEVRDRAELDKLGAEVEAFLKNAGLLKAEQVSKTEQYFKVYFGK
ncbi:MAG: hypothetical protein FJ107_04065 [Deltaproteobacteria bacterium]|nr:hypothetical protein [Deltaproteobacteria bacterium]